MENGEVCVTGCVRKGGVVGVIRNVWVNILMYIV